MKKLYVKFFDVDWDEATAGPVPLATVEIDTARLTGLEIVPTIFITNRTLLNLSMANVDTLAGLIFQKINAIAPTQPQEVQFDCDWSAQTQAKFFALLERFKEKMPGAALTATIRLHQLKYFEKTGVPPVSRGMLMCYNMGDLENWGTENSILDAKILKTYLAADSPVHSRSKTKLAVRYPLPLDIALPLFHWGVLFRDGEMIKLFNNLGEHDLQDTNRFKKIAANRFEVLKSTYLQAHYLYTGDQLRLEAVTPQALNEAAALVSYLGAEPQVTVAFYHLDTTALRIFPTGKIREILQRF